VVLEKFKEQFLQPLSEVDRLLAIAVPSHAHATFLKNKIPSNTVFLGHFFDENQNSHWLEFLREEGFFAISRVKGAGRRQAIWREWLELMTQRRSESVQSFAS